MVWDNTNYQQLGWLKKHCCDCENHEIIEDDEVDKLR